MSTPWKLLPIAAIAAVLGAFLLAPGGLTRPETASAAIDCEADTGVIQVLIRDLDNGNNPVEEPGITVRISPDPQDDGNANRNYVDNGSNDDSNGVGTIRESAACSGDADDDYTAAITDFPDDFECDIVIGSAGSPVEFGVDADTVNEVELYVGNCEDVATTVTVTVTGTVTGTAGPAATVTTNASPTSVGCSGTSIVTIQVKDAAGNPVAAGTALVINASIGSVSPSSGQTTDASGSAFVFFTAPANQGGTATITATSGSASGQATVTVNCGAASPTATTAPPPTVAPGGVITPPSTGEAGLASTQKAQVPAAMVIGFLALALLGAVAIVRARA